MMPRSQLMICTEEDTALTLDVLANDSDPEGDTLTVDSATQGSNGSVVVNANNSISYTPNADFSRTVLVTPSATVMVVTPAPP